MTFCLRKQRSGSFHWEMEEAVGEGAARLHGSTAGREGSGGEGERGAPSVLPRRGGDAGTHRGGRARAALTSSARRPPKQRGAPRDAGSGRGDGALPTRAAPCSQQGHQPKNERPRRACSSPHCQHSPFPVNVLPGTRRQAPGPSPRSVPAQASPGPQPPPARCPPSVPAARSDLTASAHPLLRPPGPTPRSGRTEREFPSPTGGAPRIWPAPHRGVSPRRATRVPGPHSAAPRPQGASSASRGSRGRPSCCGIPTPKLRGPSPVRSPQHPHHRDPGPAARCEVSNLPADRSMRAVGPPAPRPAPNPGGPGTAAAGSRPRKQTSASVPRNPAPQPVPAP